MTMPPRPWSRFAFRLLLVALVLVVIEGSSFVVYRFTVGSFFSYGSDARARQGLLAEGNAQGSGGNGGGQDQGQPRIGTMANQVLHPFLGYVQKPSRIADHLAVGPWGFVERSPAPPRADNAFRIGIVGGSVGYLFSFSGAEALLDELAGAEFLDGRPFEIFSLALGGMKQPQQLMTVAWMLSVGQRYDLIVNIDGFNEVAFGAENARRGVFPAFPRNWSLRVSEIDSLDELEALGRASAWSRIRRKAAQAFDVPLVSATVTGNLMWRLLDRAMTDRLAEAEEAVATAVSAGLGYVASGPPFAAADDDAIYRAVAGHWAHASIALDRLCRGFGIRYVHLLQPNQYVPDSKPMGAKERARAFDPNHPQREAVLAGFPRLRDALGQVRDAGVDVHDLTGLFQAEQRAVYSDTCCHFNRLGNELIAYRLASILR